ncbi:MAG: hypothetical protein IKA10_06475 [Oscillospiraceae bacterium]|nr:hypothetical protein [Oscillospiraceae bacterium]
MKKLTLISIVLSLFILLSACSNSAEQQVETDMDNFFSEVAQTNFQSDKTSAELEAEIKTYYDENDIISYNQIHFCNFEKNGYKVAVYSFVNRDYTDHFYIICRFKGDKLIGYIKPDNTVIENATNDFDSLYFTQPMECKSNDDLSHIELNNIYSTARSFVINFDDGSFRYVKKEIETDLSYLHSLSDEQCKTAIAEQFLKPLAKAELIGNYYKDTDQITKMLAFYGQTDLSEYDTVNDGDGRTYVNVPGIAVMEYLRKHFAETDSFIFKASELYNKETDTFRIYIDKEDYPYNIYVGSYILSHSSLIVNEYTITDETGVEIARESCYFSRENNHYLFNYCKDFEDFIEAAQEGERYVFALGEAEGGGDSWAYDVILTDNETGKSKNLGREYLSSAISDYGRFSNGDIYVMNYRGLTVFDTDMDNPNPIFTTKTNFPCTISNEAIDNKGTHRYLFAIRRDPVTFEYVVIYGEYIEDEVYENNYLNDFQMAHNYRIGILDKTGKLIKSWDTGVPIMFTVFGFENTYMKKVGDNEYEMFVTYKDSLRLSGRFNTENETYTPIKEFKID